MWVKSFIIDILVHLIEDLSKYRVRAKEQPHDVMDEEWAVA